jgi:hypothetical protein
MLSGQFARKPQNRSIDGALMPSTNSEEKPPPSPVDDQPSPPTIQPNLGLLKATCFAGGVFATLAVIVSILLLLRIFR